MTFNEYYNNLNSEIKEYFKIICPVFPKFLIPFIESKTLMRLKDISYFCGAEHGSKKVYDFKYSISRLDHSISTALFVWVNTYDEYMTLAALFHDATTPALSHVIDYFNGDYINQESTELDLVSYINMHDKDLVNYIKTIGLDINKIANFKNYSLVDMDRPMLCADRLDFVFLNNLAWSKEITIEEVKEIYNHLVVRKNEYDKLEFAFDDIDIADRVVELNDIVNNLTKSKSDYNEMFYLSILVGRLLEINVINYEDLFVMTDNEVFELILDNIEDDIIYYYYQRYKYMENNLELTDAKIKNRVLNPLVNNVRYSDYC